MNIVVIVIIVHFCQVLNEYDVDGDHLHFCLELHEYDGDCGYFTFLSPHPHNQ